MKWLKDNWLIVAIALVVAALIYGQVNNMSLYDKLMEDYNNQAQSHKAQIEALEKVNEEQTQMVLGLHNEYAARLEIIQTEFNGQLNKVKAQRTVERRRLVEETRKNPSALTQEIQQVFGIPVYQKELEKK